MKFQLKLVVLTLCLSLSVQSFAQTNSPTSKLDPPLTSAQIAAAMTRDLHPSYFHRVFVGLDHMAGALVGRQNDQTISSALEICSHHHKACVPFNAALDVIQPSHGQKAQAGDIIRARLLILTDAAALTAETGVQVIPTVAGATILDSFSTRTVTVAPDGKTVRTETQEKP